jgi:hypothetical protein
VRPRRSLSRRSSSSHLTVGGYVIAETVVIRAKTEAEEDAMSEVGQGEMPGEGQEEGHEELVADAAQGPRERDEGFQLESGCDYES